MNTNSSSMSLVIGVAAFGLALVVATVLRLRRRRVGGAAAPQDVATTSKVGTGDKERRLEEPSLDDGEAPRGLQSAAPRKDQLLLYFLLILVLSIPFYVFGGQKLPIPVNLPASALMLIVPVTAASFLTYKQRGYSGVTDFFKRAFDFRKITNGIWYIPILLSSPLLYLLSYIVMRLVGLPLPDPNIPIPLVPVFCLVFFIEAVLEELGWMGYAIDPMQSRWGALRASIMMGLVWQIWHIIPDLQLHHTANWIFWHTLQGVALRILMVWIYNKTGRSVFSSVLIHAVDNLSWFLFPNFGTGFDPFFGAIFGFLVTGIVILGWGPKTSARYRHARAS